MNSSESCCRLYKFKRRLKSDATENICRTLWRQIILWRNWIILLMMVYYLQKSFQEQLSTTLSTQVTTSGSEKWGQRGSALNLHSFYWPAGGDSTGCQKKSVWMSQVSTKITLCLTWFMSSVNWFQRLLWSQSLVSSLLQYSMMLI